MSYTTEQVALQQRFHDFCKSKGMKDNAISGAMGNISAECEWNLNLIEVGSGDGFGLFQWSYTRRTQLEAYGTDETHQFNFFWSELSGENLATTGADKQWFNAQGYTYDNYINDTYTPSDSASAFCWCFERPNADLAHEALRQSEAEYFYTEFSGGENPPIDPPIDPPSGTVGEVYTKLEKTPYNLKQLSSEQITFLKTLKFNDSVKMKFTFNHNKRQVGQNFLGNKLTFDNKEYKIRNVLSNGYIQLATSGNICYKNINPRYIVKI